MKNSTQVFMAVDLQGKMENRFTPNGLQACSMQLVFACLSAKPRYLSVGGAVFTGRQLLDAFTKKNIWDVV